MTQGIALIALYTCLFFGVVVAASGKCPCDHEKDCDHPIKDVGIESEVFVFTNGTTDLNGWNWDSITTLIIPSIFNISNKKEANLMCLTHSKKRKFGITVEMSFPESIESINETSDKAKEWVQYVVSRQKEWHAEIITVNLVPYFVSDSSSIRQDHTSFVKILKTAKDELAEITEVVKIACVIPWKPPCTENDASCDFTPLSNDVCDYYIINPESFTDVVDVKCRARATIPLSKLLYGISEYISWHIASSKIILGVPWHGYDYACESIIQDVCSLQEMAQNNTTKCNFSKRLKVSIGNILTNNITNFYDHKFNTLYNAPYYNYYNSIDGHQHQVWFEDQASLITKYRLVIELQLGGLGLLYGDDLFSSVKNPITESSMWTWVAHELMLANSKKPVTNNLYYADTISGVAVGCLLLGAAFGIVFTCFGLRGYAKKPRPNYARDLNQGLNEYTDDDQNL